MAGPVSVLIVDDHRVVARGLALALEGEPDLHIAGVAESVKAAVAAASELLPDVVVSDFHLPDGTGADVVQGVKEVAPAAKVLILSADVEDETMLSAVDAGAAGYLEKTIDERELAAAVRRVAAGEILIPPATLVRLLGRQRALRREEAEQAAATALLTPREREILALVAQGLDGKTIARRLGISLSTARWHTQKVIEKLDAHARLEAVARAVALGLVER